MEAERTWGGRRPGSGPRVRRIRLDDETTGMLRVLSRQSGTDEQTIVANLIKREYGELDQEYDTREITEAGLQEDLADYIHDNIQL